MRRRRHLYVYPFIVLLPILLLLYLGSAEADVYAAGPRQQEASFSVSRNILSFRGVEGGPNPRPQRFGITHTGSEPINWSVSVDGSAAWLDVVPTSGLDDGVVRVNVDTTGLISGTFTETLTVSAQETTAIEVITVTLVVTSTVTPLYAEDFQAYAPGTNPVDWLDTGAESSLEEDDSLFAVFDVGGERVFGTSSTLTNIHSHYVGAGSDAFSSYEYTGRMRMTATGGGIGVTFLSQYPQADAHYRLRRYGTGSFLLIPQGTTLTGGTTDTGVVPAPNVWYLFRIQVEDTGIRTEIRAKVWDEGATEPSDWQVDCSDASATRLAAGRVGVWSYTSGSKYWDDLVVNPLSPEADGAPPFAHGHDPAPGAANVDPSSDIAVHVADSSMGVYSATLAMTVGGVPVTPKITGSPLDYTLTYDPLLDFEEGDVVTVTVDACDLAGPANCTDIEVYSFAVRAVPVIDVWYGPHQVFGHIGIPQQWVNILGNVSDWDEMDSLTYSLNGGPEFPLSMGPDYRRLESEGDFNVDIAYADLDPGLNQVVITATDSFNNQAVETVTVEYISGNVWPEPYFIDWSSVTTIPSVAQVVDGLWTKEADSIRPVILGYDRLVAIGDYMTWDDYEVTVPVTIHEVDMDTGPASGGPGLGILMRWTGHTDSPVPGWQPKSGWNPFGAIGLWRWSSLSSATLQFYQTGISQNFLPALEVRYIFKMRVESVPGQGGLYSLKVWEDGQPEPSAWNLIYQADSSNLAYGSFMLLAHHVDASFGDVTAIPSHEYTLTVNEVGDGSVDKDPDQTTYHYGDVVTLTATADPGWTFAGWSGALSGTEITATLTITGNTTVTATFTQDEYDVTVTIVGQGSVINTPGNPYYYNETATLEPVADAGRTFTGWGGPDAGGLSDNSDGTWSITMDGNKSITATFTQDEHQIFLPIITVQGSP